MLGARLAREKLSIIALSPHGDHHAAFHREHPLDGSGACLTDRLPAGDARLTWPGGRWTASSCTPC
jgi:hypothetical protein